MPFLPYPYYGYTDDSKYPITLATSNLTGTNTPKTNFNSNYNYNTGSRPHSLTLASAYNAFLDPDLTPMAPLKPGSTPQPGKLHKSKLQSKSPLGPGAAGGEMYDLGFEEDITNLRYTGINYRGIITLGGLLSLITGILALFVFYPIFAWFHFESGRVAIVGNARVNGSGQVPDL